MIKRLCEYTDGYGNSVVWWVIKQEKQVDFEAGLVWPGLFHVF